MLINAELMYSHKQQLGYFESLVCVLVLIGEHLICFMQWCAITYEEVSHH